MDNYLVGTPIYVNEKGMLYPLRHVSGKRYSAQVMYRDMLKTKGDFPDFLEHGRNILNAKGWENFAAERKKYIAPKNSSLKINIYEGDDSESDEIDIKNSIIQLQIIDPDIIVVENFVGLNSNKYDIVAIKDYDRLYTNLSFRPGKQNFVQKMNYYDEDVVDLLNSSLYVLLDKDMRAKYPFINITEVKPEKAKEALDNSGRTIFAMRKGPNIHDYFKEEKRKRRGRR